MIKKTICYITITIAVISVLIYSALWFYIALTLSAELNTSFADKKHQLLKGISDNSYYFTFHKAKPEGFPFKFGIQLQNVVEEDIDGVITHNQPLYIGYDIFKQRVYVSYQGHSAARAKPLESGYGTDIEGKYDYYFACPMNMKLLHMLYNADSGFEIINFIKSFTFNVAHIKVIDALEKSLLFKASNMVLSLHIPDMPYYHKIDELFNNIPGHYHIFSSAQIDDIAYGKKLSSLSLVYGPLSTHFLTHKIDVDLYTAAKTFNISDILKNLEVKTNSFDYSDNTESSSNKSYYKSEFVNNHLSLQLQHSSTTKPKTGFFEHKLEQWHAIAQALLQIAPRQITSLILEPFLANSKKYLPKNNILPETITTNIDLSFAGQSNKFQLSVKDISCLVDGIGFSLSNTSHVDTEMQWQTQGLLSLYGYQQAIDSITSYMNDIDAHPNVERLEMYRTSYKDFARAISNHPESKSKDIFLDYEFSAANPVGKISSYTVPQVLGLYYQMLYSHALSIAQKSPDFTQKLQTLLPDIANKPEILEQLKSQAEGQKTKNSPAS